MINYNRSFTPDHITSLRTNEVFVFGSNLQGRHGGGAARAAYNHFGAVWGVGVGMQGQSYAIPTMHGGVDAIRPYVEQFIDFARNNPDLTFLVTPIGCGIAGFTPAQMAPLFQDAISVENILLPRSFVNVLTANAEANGQCVNDLDVASIWDPESDFLKSYRIYKEKMRKGDDKAYGHIKQLRSKEFLHTVYTVNMGAYITADGQRYDFPDDTEMINNTAYYRHEIRLQDMPCQQEPTPVEVVDDDCLHLAMELKEQGYNPAVLNLASRQNPGGGVLGGAGAQEEGLFRRTNLFRSLYQFKDYAGKYGLKASSHQYPLDRNFGGIYTPNAICFREGEHRGYALMAHPVSLSFITVAGMKYPALESPQVIASHLVEPIKNKMRTIFRIGLLHNHDCLVLGALGCGAFCNPPRHIARLFHEVMEETEFKNKFRLVTFAILDNPNKRKSHNPEGNLTPFVEEFAGMGRKTQGNQF